MNEASLLRAVPLKTMPSGQGQARVGTSSTGCFGDSSLRCGRARVIVSPGSAMSAAQHGDGKGRR